MKYIAIFLVLLCCFMGTASAAEDVSTDVVSDSVDDVVVNAVQDEISNSSTKYESGLTVSDDTTIEEIDEDIKTDEISEESAKVDSEQTRAFDVNVNTWAGFKTYGASSFMNYNIHLTGPITVDNTNLVFGNSATIIGTPSNYITGGDSTKTIFKSTGDLDITFENVTFKNMDALVLMELTTSGHNRLINCNFENIHTYDSHSSVVWNHGGWMTITDCNFTNCNNSFGAITNHLTYNTVFMNVENCRFENNYGRYEPGAINNCGIMNVTNCVFINNRAYQWAGAIHTHSKAYTRIVGSNFTDNVAGTNGGALFSYSKLEVINSNFTGNNATNNGGAICGYSYGSTYNITVVNSTFTKNKASSGGAIRAINLGHLNVSYSNFTKNNASSGQAISGITETINYCNCVNCTCQECPNCINCTHYISNESANLKLYNNIYLNHTGTSDTVIISGNEYIFNYNVFINSTQKKVFNGTGNKYNQTTYPNPLFNLNLMKSNLGSSILGDSSPHDIIYVNTSLETNDPFSEDVHGSDWADAYGGIMGLMYAGMMINNGGTIYLADTNFPNFSLSQKNVTLIGWNRSSTFVDPTMYGAFWSIGGADFEHYLITCINMTFVGSGNIANDVTFINCTFINFTTSTNAANGINEAFYRTAIDGHHEDYEDSFVTKFIGCDFANSTMNEYMFTQLNFENCNFNDTTADSIVNNTGGFTNYDAINFKDCTFTNVNIKGLVDVPEGTPIGAEEGSRVHIEGCTGLSEGEPLTDGGRIFVNSTKSRAETFLVCDIDDEGNLLINLTDKDGKAMAEYEVLINVNNGEATPYSLGSDGTLSIPLTDLTDATSKLNITVIFEESDDYKESSDSISTVLVVNTVTEVINNTIVEYVNKTLESTSIDANALTATAKVAKTLSVTLKDASGKTIANKIISYSINGVTKTAKTDANGIVKITVNQAKAGTYYYSLCFLGDDDYKSAFKSVKVTVNKQATKAVFKAKSFKVKAKTKKVSFTLKDAKGKAIKGKKITFTVNKKTYTAKTNAKGVATVKVKLTKKGKYTAVAKFAGDTTYKAVSKKAKITVK